MTDVMLSPEFSTLEYGKVTNGVANAASLYAITDSSCHSGFSSVKVSQQPLPVRHNATRPKEVLGLEELLSELIARAPMLDAPPPPRIERLVSAPLTFGRMIANSVKSTCTSTTPRLWVRAGDDACLSSLHSKIDPSKLAAGAVL